VRRVAVVEYARVSTRDQHPEAQTHALAAAGCEKTFTEHASGTLARRPALDEALSYLRAGDTLVVTKLDRLGRSVRNLKQIADDLQARQVGLRAVSQGIDTTPGGRPFGSVNLNWPRCVRPTWPHPAVEDKQGCPRLTLWCAALAGQGSKLRQVLDAVVSQAAVGASRWSTGQATLSQTGEISDQGSTAGAAAQRPCSTQQRRPPP